MHSGNDIFTLKQKSQLPGRAIGFCNT